MFYKPLNEAIWDNIRDLTKPRCSSNGIKLSLDNIYGWGLIVSLKIDKSAFISIYITELDINKILSKFFPSIYLGTLTSKEIYSLIPFFTSSLASIFGSDCSIVDAYLLEIETPSWLLKFELPDSMQEEVFKGFSIYIYDANINIILDYVKEWGFIEESSSLSEINVKCLLELSRASLSENDFLSLAKNKIILLDKNLNTDPKKALTAFLVYGKRIAEFSCNSLYGKPSIKCIKVYQKRQEQEGSMTDGILTTTENVLGEEKVAILASVGHVKMSLEDLQKLSEEQIIEKDVELYQSVYLIARGVVIAKAELFWLNTQWAVRIIEVVRNIIEVDKLKNNITEDIRKNKIEEQVS